MDKEILTSSSNLFNSSSRRVITNTADDAVFSYALDMDKDGDIDVLSASYNDDTIAWYENNGQRSNPAFTKRVITTTANGAHSVFAVDIDRDGDIDVLSASAIDNTIAWYENMGQISNPTFTKRIITTTAVGAHSVFAADIDGDGDIDVLSASPNDHTVAWYENMGQSCNPTFTKRIISNTATSAVFVYAVDIDGDGDMDVLAAIQGANTVAWFENGGQSSNPTFTKRVITNTAGGARSVYAADLDGDGDIDVLSTSWLGNTIAWYENGGQSSNLTFIEHVITNTADGPFSIYAADIDGDGDMDILTALYSGNTINWYENMGQNSNPTFTNHIITNLPLTAYNVYAVDIDGDGDMDVLSSSAGDDTIAWYQNYKFSFINCATGKYYGVINGSSSCINCAVGSYQNETGKSSCKGCPIGSYQDETGKSSCKSCPTSTYQDESGKSSCKSCPTGTNNTLEGRTSLSSCKIKNIYKDLLFMDL